MFQFLSNGLALFTQNAFAQAADVAVVPGAAGQPPGWMQFVPFVVIIAVFYIFLIRPQAKKQKETQSFLSALKVGDEVVTQSGLLGRVRAIEEKIVNLEIANNVQIKVLRSAILTSQSFLQTKKEAK